MPEQQTQAKQYEARTYYIKDPRYDWWGFFTIAPEIGLLQVFCALASWTDHFHDRWSAPGPDFKQFLIKASPAYIVECLESTTAQYSDRSSGKSQQLMQKRLRDMMIHLWPLFIEQLKVEREQAKEAV